MILVNAISFVCTTLFLDPYYGGTIDGIVIPVSIVGYLGWRFVSRKPKDKTLKV